MKQHIFVATINVAVEANNETEAADAIAYALRTAIIHGDYFDWEYSIDKEGRRTEPLEVGIVDINEEGDAFAAARSANKLK
jgi:hypothetical protein